MTNSIADLGEADVILVMGSNTTEAHPIIGIELKRAAKRGTKIIVVDPRRIRLVDHAEKWLRLQPGTNIPLLNALMKVIVDEGLQDESFIDSRTEGFDELLAVLERTDDLLETRQTGVEARLVPRHLRRSGTRSFGGLLVRGAHGAGLYAPHSTDGSRSTIAV